MRRWGAASIRASLSETICGDAGQVGGIEVLPFGFLALRQRHIAVRQRLGSDRRQARRDFRGARGGPRL